MLALVVFFTLVAGNLIPGEPRAQSGPANPLDKLSTALRQALTEDVSLVWQNPSSGTVRVILQTNGAVSVSLIAAIVLQGATVVRQFSTINGLLIELPKSHLLAVAAMPEVERISADHLVRSSGSHLEATTGAEPLRSYNSLLGTFTGLDGKCVGIAVLDSGIMSTHADLRGLLGLSRVTAATDIVSSNSVLRQFEELLALPLPILTGNVDGYGHGSHVAGAAAGCNRGSGSSPGFEGIAPGANLIDVRVLDGYGFGQVSDVIAGVDWVVQNRVLRGIKVANLSLAASSAETWMTDPLCRAVRSAVASGITVVTAAGNYGKTDDQLERYGSITSPADDPTVITVGAANTHQTNLRGDDSVTSFSSRGPTRGYSIDADGTRHYDNLLKPDLLAPGNRIVSAESTNNYLVRNFPELHVGETNPSFMQLSGTSIAAPVVAGAVALMLQKNPGLTPPLIKAILQYTAQQVPNANLVQQGAGLLNIEGATRVAGALRTDIASKVAQGTIEVGDNILASGAFRSWQGKASHGEATFSRVAAIFSRAPNSSRDIRESMIHASSGRVPVSQGMDLRPATES
jgi:subtilisin family serine protease